MLLDQMIDSARKEEEKLHQIEQKMLNIKRSYENARCNSIAKNSIMEILNISIVWGFSGDNSIVERLKGQS